MAGAIIKCPTCGWIGGVVPQDLNNGQLVYTCQDCGNDFQVEFFEHCPRCQVNIGFIDSGSFKNDIREFGLGIIKSAVNPLSTVTNFGGWIFDAVTGQAKECNGDGLCPICKLRYLRCPSCNNLFQIPKSANTKDKFDCPHCGTTVWPGYSIRPGCGGKHSTAFYKWPPEE